MGNVITLSPDIPFSCPLIGGGDRSLDCAGGGGVAAFETRQLLNKTLDKSGGFTFEDWFRWNGGGSVNSLIDYAGTEQIILSGGKLSMGTNNAIYHTLGIPTPGVWHYVAVVFKATSASAAGLTGDYTYYFDSNTPSDIVSNITKSNFGDGFNRTIGVGMHPEGFGGNFFDGLIYSPRVTLAPLSSDQLLLKNPLAAQDTALIQDGADLYFATRFPYTPGSILVLQGSSALQSWGMPGTNDLPRFTVERAYKSPNYWNVRSLLPVTATPNAFLRAYECGTVAGPGTFADYDGDGKSDCAITRNVDGDIHWNIVLQSGTFTYLPSTGGPAVTLSHAVSGDYPVANSQVQ